MEKDFSSALPEEIRQSSKLLENGEWVIPSKHVEKAIDAATKHNIAVLGVEVFRVLTDGLACQEYSGYEFRNDTNWKAFVDLNNREATNYFRSNRFGFGFEYVLTTTSEQEFNSLKIKNG